MKITYLHQYFTTPQQAGGIRSYEMARRLVQAGHQVTMITSLRESPEPGEQAQTEWRVSNEAGIEVHWLPVPYSNRMSYPQRIRAFLRFALRAAGRAAAVESDVIFATSTPLTIAIPAVWAARRRGVPMVFEVRDLWPELPIAVGALKGPLIPAAQQLEKFAYRNAAAIVALSPGMKDGIVRQGYPADKVTVIPNSCDMELFANAGAAGHALRRRFDWLGDRPLVIYAGTLGLINGVGYLAQIADKVARLAPEVRFLVVGDGAEWEKVQTQARALGVLDRTFFMLKSLPKLEMPALFAAATLSTSLFVDLPEMWANSANKFFDALAAGKPIAINYKGWQADLLGAAGAGIVVPAAGEAGATAAAVEIVRVLHDPAWLERAGAASHELARTYFDRAMLARKLEQVLAVAVAARQRS